jgi:hypothetical protein
MFSPYGRIPARGSDPAAIRPWSRRLQEIGAVRRCWAPHQVRFRGGTRLVDHGSSRAGRTCMGSSDVALVAWDPRAHRDSSLIRLIRSGDLHELPRPGMCDRQRVARRILLQALKDFAPRSCNVRQHEEIRRRMNGDRRRAIHHELVGSGSNGTGMGIRTPASGSLSGNQSPRANRSKPARVVIGGAEASNR